jgi:hypothetical protein
MAADIEGAIAGTAVNFRELERRLTMHRRNDAQSFEEVPAPSAGVEGL